MAGTDVEQRDGTEAGTAEMLYAGAVAGVVLRGVTWVLSAFTVGPLFGMFDMVIASYGSRETALFTQAIVTVAAVVAAALCGLGLQTDPARYRLRTRLLGTLFIADVFVYLAPVVAVVAFNANLDLGLTTSAWWLFGVAVLGNLALAGLAVLIIVRSRRLRPAPATAVAA